jgi:hypothetical protein
MTPSAVLRPSVDRRTDAAGARPGTVGGALAVVLRPQLVGEMLDHAATPSTTVAQRRETMLWCRPHAESPSVTASGGTE